MYIKKIKFILLLVAVLVAGLQVNAEIILPRVLGSNMVLQQQKPLPVWGKAGAGEKVTVMFSKQVKHTIADTAGNWKVMLDPLTVSARPQTMTITGSNTIKLDNILVGEVWVCSGQSNMQYSMSWNNKINKPGNPPGELKKAHNQLIRIFWASDKNLKTTGDSLATWNIAQDSALAQFSAAGYFFAKNLYEGLKVPIGIVSSAMSGSYIEPWIPIEAFATPTKYKPGGTAPNAYGKLYHSMIAPLAPFAIRGFLWYQGESNMRSDEGIKYTYKMQALINTWRNLWRDAVLPFYYVQIASFHYTTWIKDRPIPADRLPQLWEAQAMALNMPNTGMITITDLNDNLKNLHPPYKWEVGRRLALVALGKTYGKKIVYAGPAYKQMQVVGNKIELEFTDTGSPLVSKDGGPLNWFTIAGTDGNFVAANAVIEGNKVVVSSPEVAAPTAVRFGWDEGAQPNLFNKAGLPAVPFRTDNPLKFVNN